MADFGHSTFIFIIGTGHHIRRVDAALATVVNWSDALITAATIFWRYRPSVCESANGNGQAAAILWR